MKKITKFIFGVCLAIGLVMAFTGCATKIIPRGKEKAVKVYKYKDTNGNIFQYYLSYGGVSILNFDGNNPEIVIPDSIKDRNVVYIDMYAFYNKNLTGVTLPKYLEYIRDAAFANNKLKTITIPDKVISLGNFAFYGNPLETITIEEFTGKSFLKSQIKYNYDCLGSLTPTLRMNNYSSGVYALKGTGWTYNGKPIRNYAALVLNDGAPIRFLSIDGKPIQSFYKEAPSSRIWSDKKSTFYWYYIPVGEHTINIYYFFIPTNNNDYYYDKITGKRVGYYNSRIKESPPIESETVSMSRVFENGYYYLNSQYLSKYSSIDESDGAVSEATGGGKVLFKLIRSTFQPDP